MQLFYYRSRNLTLPNFRYESLCEDKRFNNVQKVCMPPCVGGSSGTQCVFFSAEDSLLIDDKHMYESILFLPQHDFVVSVGKSVMVMKHMWCTEGSKSFVQLAMWKF